MPEFGHLLNVKADDVKEVPVMPQGTYLARVGQYEFKEVTTKNGDKRSVMVVPLQLTSRVTGEGELPPRLPELKHTFWLTEDDGSQNEHTLNPLKQFIEACGVVTSGRQIGEAMPETLNQMVGVNIVHSNNPKNPERPYVNIRGFAPA